MFEKFRSKEHMEIVGSDGEHVGTVDMVDRVEDNRIYLKVTKAEAQVAKC